MVKKALGRHGINADDASSDGIMIEVVDNGYLLNGKKVHSIGMLLDMLNDTD